MDLTASIEPRSDQINSDDLIAGPITYTIREVIAGKAESPFDFLLVETDRAYRPSKTMRRVIVNAWGPEASAYAGRRLTLYREPSITFGREVVGGIRVSHMSNIDGPKKVRVQVTRGKREEFTVDPLPDVSPEESPRDKALRGIAEAANVETVTRVLQWAEGQAIDVAREATERRAAIQSDAQPADDIAAQPEVGTP